LSSHVAQSSINEEVVETTSAVNTLDQINNFENALSYISSSINNSGAKKLTEDNNVTGVSELTEYETLLIEDYRCGRSWTLCCLYNKQFTLY